MPYLLDTHAFLWFIGGDERLPFHHRDPFDRLIIAQAITENLPIMSKDAEFGWYAVKTLW